MKIDVWCELSSIQQSKQKLAVLVEAESPKEIDILQCSQFTVTACSCLRKCFYPQAANFDKKNKKNNKSQWQTLEPNSWLHSYKNKNVNNTK